jgi:hypothetical protein
VASSAGAIMGQCRFVRWGEWGGERDGKGGGGVECAGGMRGGLTRLVVGLQRNGRSMASPDARSSKWMYAGDSR